MIRIEHRLAEEPAWGLGTTSPRLSWPATAEDRFEVEVNRSPWGGEAVTTTHGVTGHLLVPWPGEPLSAHDRVDLRVRPAGGDWGGVTSLSVGPLTRDGWAGASLISPDGIGALDQPAPALRTTFDIPGEVAQARLTLTGHGWLEPHLNGAPATDAWFAPGWSVYPKRLRYAAHDVTELVRAGANDLTILLGNGWYRGQLTWDLNTCVYGDRLGALVRLDVCTTDGAVITVVSDESWTSHETNVLANDLYDGEVVDLRRPLIDTAAHPVSVHDLDFATLVAEPGPPVRVIDTVPAQKVWRSPSGALLVDFGVNVVGVVRLTVGGHDPGHEVTIRHAEVLEHDELGTRPLRKAKATDHFVLAGAEVEVVQPRFTFHGFRYAQVDGLGDLASHQIEAVVLSSDQTRTGWFSCSNDLVNQLHANVVRGMQGNFVDVPTDCPQRDERLGWTGDLQVFSPTAAYLFDSAGLLSGWLADLALEQKGDGEVPFVVPDVIGGFGGACAWGDAAVIVPWNLYLASGDAEILRAQWASMQGWVDFIESRSTGGLWLGGFQFGDWLDPDAPPDDAAAAKADPDVVATACSYRCADAVARTAEVLGDEQAAERYRAWADGVRDAFLARFVSADGSVQSDCQTVYAAAICWGLLDQDDDQRMYAGARLADLVRTDGFCIATGFVGTPLVTEALTQTGWHDVAMRLVEQTQCPSWLYPVTMGATTIWERWDSMLPDGTINPGEMTSFNHYALGAVADWLHRRVAGLTCEAPGWTRVRITPGPAGSITSAATRYLSPHGEISVSWTLDDGVVTLDVDVPVGVEAGYDFPDGTSGSLVAGHHRVVGGDGRVGQRPIRSIRDVVDDQRAWKTVVDALAAATGQRDERRVARQLRRQLDQPASALGPLITYGGRAGWAAPVIAAVNEVLATG